MFKILYLSSLPTNYKQFQPVDIVEKMLKTNTQDEFIKIIKKSCFFDQNSNKQKSAYKINSQHFRYYNQIKYSSRIENLKLNRTIGRNF